MLRHLFYTLCFVGIPTLTLHGQSRPNILLVLADDWSFPHAGAYGDTTLNTPHFDRLAKEGLLFENAFCNSPSCTPSRASLLTGMYPHQLESGAQLWGSLSVRFPNFASILADSGYHVGFSEKGWGPGNFEAGGYSFPPTGQNYPDFETFLKKRGGKPFCYWHGSFDPHRPYEPDLGLKSGIKKQSISLPGILPDTVPVREDVSDYYYEVERLDRKLGMLLARLERMGELENTIIVVTSDNGMPFPRAKANLYDLGTRIPLVLYWKNKIPPGGRTKNFVSLMDLAPTFLELAGLVLPKQMEGQSLRPYWDKSAIPTRMEEIFLERERHAYCRKNNVGYPMRAIRTEQFLYIQNLYPDRWPAGDPELVHSVGAYGDCDESITKDVVMNLKNHPKHHWIFDVCFGKRPSEELYELASDPNQVHNLAQNPNFEGVVAQFRNKLKAWQQKTGDPRANSAIPDPFDSYPYYGPGTSLGKANKHPRKN